MTIAIDQNPAPIFPEDLLSDAYPGKTWNVFHVKSRREKALADFLFRRGIAYYLPLVKKRQASRNRVRYSLVPLFSGYVFVNCDETGRHAALKSNHVGRIIEVKDGATLVQELRQVHQALFAEKALYPVDFVSVGQRVRVIKGPMKDVEGIVFRKDKKFRLALAVTSIMQSISVEIDADMVEPC